MFCSFGFQTRKIVWSIKGIVLRIAEQESREKTVDYKKRDNISLIIVMNSMISKYFNKIKILGNKSRTCQLIEIKDQYVH